MLQLRRLSKGGFLKKFNLFTLTLFAMAIGLSACNVKTSNNKMKELEKQWDDDKKKNDELLEKLQKSLEQGGQPASIKVSGIIVKDDRETDVRISIISKGGIGKDGTQAIIADSNKPVLSSKNEKLQISKLNELKTLISLGCDPKMVVKVAKERSLKIERISEPSMENLRSIFASTILLCGDMEKISAPSLTGQYFVFLSDELILNKVDYSLIYSSGLLSFNTNKLVLIGSNKLATKGADHNLTPFLELNVLKEITSDEKGKLILMSTGGDYKKPAAK